MIMRKHILSQYATKGKIENIKSSSFFKKTIKTFSVENSDENDFFMMKTTDVSRDSTETIENSIFENNIELKRTKLTETIENSDANEMLR